MSIYHRVLAVEELSPNSSRAVDLDGVNILISNVGGSFYAVDGLCTHQGSPLEGGRIRNCFISCPRHGVRFDLRDGSVHSKLTKIPLTSYPTRIIDGVVEVLLH